jgi:DNA polymerase I
MAQPKRVVLVDGSWLIFRAFFAIPATFSTKAGLPTNATYGFATMFRKLFDGKHGRRPELGAVVFDAPGKTFRDEKYPQYKADRPPMANELQVQLPYIDRVVGAAGFPLLRVPGYEADDVLGTLARRAEAEGHDVTVISGDKDFAQLVTDKIRILDTMRDVSWDREFVRKKWGVRPDQIVDLLALMGDAIDNIPGVPGIGQKGAADLLEAHGSLTGIYEALASFKGKRKQSLEDNRAIAFLSRELATIETNATLEVTVDELVVHHDVQAPLDELFRELEFYSLLSDKAGATGAPSGDETGGDTHSGEASQAPTTLAGAAAIESYLAAAKSPWTLVGQWETGAQLSAVTARWSGLLLLPADGDDAAFLALDDAAAREVVARHLSRSDIVKICHDAKELAVALGTVDIPLLRQGPLFDTMLASFLVEPTKVIPHRLEQVAKEYLQRGTTLAKGTPPAIQATADARAIRDLEPILRAKVEEMGLTEQLGRDLALSSVLGEMERVGILVDADSLARLGIDFEAEKAEVEKKIHELAGRPFNVGSPKQLGEVLFDELKLPVQKRTKTGYSTDAEVLETLAKKHEIASAVLRHRTLAKLINTYTDVLQRAVVEADGRVHATFQQTTGASGRLISTDPDLQRTPVKTPEGKRIREAFVAAPGHVLVSADWSQIELRVLAHFSRDAQLVAAFRDRVDVHTKTASLLFGVAAEEVTKEQRGVGKTVNFATIYGQGATALGQILSVPRAEAKRFIDGYFRAYAGVRTWLDDTIAEASKTGWVETLLGRRRIIPELRSLNAIDRAAGERIAANTPIQGSAADLCKLAMLLIDERFAAEKLSAKLLLQVHDELVFEVPAAELEPTIATIRASMERPWPLEVPLVVDIGHGPTWAAAH